jgi:hypothetical protein
MRYFLALFTLLSLTSCYRMPTEQDYSLVPVTNNPNLVKDKGGSQMPGVGY